MSVIVPSCVLITTVYTDTCDECYFEGSSSGFGSF